MKTINIFNEKTQIQKYGKSTPVYFFPVDNGYHRADMYISNKTGEEFVETYLCTGLNDLSPIHDIQAYYNGDLCHCCFAGYGHTEDKHNKSIKNNTK